TEIARNLPQLLAAGIKLILQLVTGIIRSVPNVMSAMGDIASGIIRSVSNINLFSAGKAIIDGFLGGLRSTWDKGKGFITGIGGWIARNKGPISYDRKLLIPAGNAIMQGLDKGLQDRFKNVKETIGGMAGAINETMVARPEVDLGNSLSKRSTDIDRIVNQQSKNLEIRPQPAYINLNIGGQNF